MKKNSLKTSPNLKNVSELISEICLVYLCVQAHAGGCEGEGARAQGTQPRRG